MIEQQPGSTYRVSLKALVLNEEQQLLLVRGSDGHYQIPGGGWEYGETENECLGRELREELCVDLAWRDERPLCTFHAYHPVLQRWNLRVCYLAGLTSHTFRFGDGIDAAQWVGQSDLIQVSLPPDDLPILGFIPRIWPL